MGDYKRARSEIQKRERLEEAMHAADTLFNALPYSDITLSSIASAMSISRSNLYKYVKTKEDIFLELYLQKQYAFFISLQDALNDVVDITPDQLTSILVELLEENTDFLRYQNILTTIIEVNVSVESLAAFKKECMPVFEDTLQLFQCCDFIPNDEVMGFYFAFINYSCGLIGGCRNSTMISEALSLAGLPDMKHDFKLEMNHFITIYLKGLKD